MTTTETRCVQIPMAPPRRLVPGARFRSFKTGPDHAVWETVMAPVHALIADGWYVTRAEVDWGKTRPLMGNALLDWLRDMTHCRALDDCELWDSWSGRGKGTTEVCLER